MKKQVVDLVRNYIRKLPEDDLSFLNSRLRDRYCGDVAEVVLLLQSNPDMDRWLSSSKTANEVYDMVDIVAQYADCAAAC